MVRKIIKRAENKSRMVKAETNVDMKEQIIHIVEEQLKNSETNYVKETFDKLLEKGIEEEKAKELIGKKLIIELREIMCTEEKFSEERYKKYLGDIFSEI